MLTCLRSARESADMPKKLVASAPVTRPSPSATEPPRRSIKHQTSRIFGGGLGTRRGRQERLTWVGEGEPLGVDPLVLLGAGHASSRSRDLHLRPLSPPRPGARPPPPQRGAGATAAAQMRQEEPDGPPRTRFGFPSRLRWTGWHFETEDPTSRRRSPVISFIFY